MMGLSAFWLAEMPFVLVLLFGILGGGIVSVLVEFTIYRPLGARRVALINIVIATLGVSIVLQNVARLVWGSEPLRYPDAVRVEGAGGRRLRRIPAADLDRDPRRLHHGRPDAVLPLHAARHRHAGGGAGSPTPRA